MTAHRRHFPSSRNTHEALVDACRDTTWIPLLALIAHHGWRNQRGHILGPHDVLATALLGDELGLVLRDLTHDEVIALDATRLACLDTTHPLRVHVECMLQPTRWTPKTYSPHNAGVGIDDDFGFDWDDAF